MSDAFLLKLTEQMLRENKKLKGTLSAKYRQGQKAGERKERDRIIKLLKPFAKHYESCYYNKELACTFEDCHAYDYEHAIKLINGEQE